jgi:hypothetical protein
VADEEEDRRDGPDALAGHVAARAVAARGRTAVAHAREARAAVADDPLHPPPARVLIFKLPSQLTDRLCTRRVSVLSVSCSLPCSCCVVRNLCF